MIAMEMIEVCAPHVAPATVQRIIKVESGNDPLAINVNKGARPRKPRTAAEAAAIVKRILATSGPEVSVDMGLMQVNSRNLAALGYTVEEMFEPCTNIAAGASVLTAFYRRAAVNFGPGQSALMAALSAYNTGSFTAGFSNGYVARYTGAQPRSVSQRIAALDPFTAETTVFIRQEKATMQTNTPVISTNFNDTAIAGVQVEVDADAAEHLGAFAETALSDADAWDANADLDAADTTPASAAHVMGRPASNVVAFPGGSDGHAEGAAHVE